MEPDRKAVRAKMMERWAIFLLGLSIGCVLLGFYFTGRQRAMQQQTPPEPVPAVE